MHLRRFGSLKYLTTNVNMLSLVSTAPKFKIKTTVVTITLTGSKDFVLKAIFNLKLQLSSSFSSLK